MQKEEPFRSERGGIVVFLIQKYRPMLRVSGRAFSKTFSRF